MMQGSIAMASRAAQLTKASYSAGRIMLRCQGMEYADANAIV
jgi:hypothetical protein